MAWVDVSSINLGGEWQGHISLFPPLLLPVLQSVFSHYFNSAIIFPFIHPLFPCSCLFTPSHFLAFSSPTPVCLPLPFVLPVSFNLPSLGLSSSSFFLAGIASSSFFSCPFHSHLFSPSFGPPSLILSPCTSPLPQLSRCCLFLLPQVSDAHAISLPLCFKRPHPTPHSRLLLMIKAKTSHQ